MIEHVDSELIEREFENPNYTRGLLELVRLTKEEKAESRFCVHKVIESSRVLYPSLIQMGTGDSVGRGSDFRPYPLVDGVHVGSPMTLEDARNAYPLIETHTHPSGIVIPSILDFVSCKNARVKNYAQFGIPLNTICMIVGIRGEDRQLPLFLFQERGDVLEETADYPCATGEAKNFLRTGKDFSDGFALLMATRRKKVHCYNKARGALNLDTGKISLSSLRDFSFGYRI